jgi:hypothetical protein
MVKGMPFTVFDVNGVCTQTTFVMISPANLLQNTQFIVNLWNLMRYSPLAYGSRIVREQISYVPFGTLPARKSKFILKSLPRKLII